MALVATPDPHIRVLWGLHAIYTSFSDTSAFEKRVVDLICKIMEGMNMTSERVNPLWISLQ